MKCTPKNRDRVGQRFAIAVHGGAAPLLAPERAPAHRAIVCDALEQAARAGHAVLARGGNALDAVQAAVVVLEDAPCLNAGRGSVLNARGEVELEASVMCGVARRAGAVTGLTSVKNPVLLARALMDHTPNVMLGFAAAEAFARERGLPTMPVDYFRTPERIHALELEQRLARRRASAARVPASGGTVGAVALDGSGNLAAATSTGGRTNKWPGRIGDSPIIGAGTYADNRACAVSATGHGEFFIRAAVAHEVVARIRHRGDSVRVAANQVVMRELVAMQGSGGLIAIDRAGSIAMPFNCGAMNRAAIDVNGRLTVAIERTAERRRVIGGR